MSKRSFYLHEIAHARSGDKGNSVNIGVIAYDEEGYKIMKEALTIQKVATYFKQMGVTTVDRYELPNLLALNFVLHNALEGGGSRSLRTDSQGKACGQAILEMKLETTL